MRLIFVILFLICLQSHGQIINASQPYRPQVASCSYLLDQYPNAAAAYSLRKLDCDYSGYAVRVRRSSDNAEQDIGFTANGDFDTSSLKIFVGSNDGHVTKWYDQSGNGLNAIQTTSASQPRIVNSGVVFRKNTKPSIEFYRTGATYLQNSMSVSGITDFYSVAVYNVNVISGINTYVISSISNQVGYQHNGDTYWGYAGGIHSNTYPNNMTTVILAEILFDGGGGTNDDRLKSYQNGSFLTSSSFSGTVPSSVNVLNIVIGALYTGALNLTGSIAEFILFNSDKSSNRISIESNINSYYSIY